MTIAGLDVATLTRIFGDSVSVTWERSLEDGEARLLAHCNAKLKPLVIAALHTGFRKSELLSLQWANIDFRHHLIKVEAAYTKTREARSVPMRETLTATLKQHKIHTITEPTARCLGIGR